jgi:hypothetical protein
VASASLFDKMASTLSGQHKCSPRLLVAQIMMDDCVFCSFSLCVGCVVSAGAAIEPWG